MIFWPNAALVFGDLFMGDHFFENGKIKYILFFFNNVNYLYKQIKTFVGVR